MEPPQKVYMRKKKRYIVKSIVIILAIFMIIGLIHLISMLTADQMLIYTEIEFASKKIRPELDGFTIALVTDTHEITMDDLEKLSENISARGVDLLLLGGDYAAKKNISKTMEILSQTKTAYGIYGVEGNHDLRKNLYWVMERNNIEHLHNEGEEIIPGFFLAGVPDLWFDEPDAKAAIRDAKPDDFVLLLSHNPDVSMLQDMSKVDIVLSGHTHGGQITFFGLWKPLLKWVTEYPSRFGGGWARGDSDVAVFVSRGSGRADAYPRVFARPEVIYLTLRSDS